MDIPILPLAVGIDAGVAPSFMTAVSQSEGGYSGRKALRERVIRTYNFNIGPDEAEEVYKIALAVRGRRYPLALRDWFFNYRYADEALDYTIETDQTVANLARTFTPATGSRSYTQRILVPDERFVPTTIKINGVAPVTGTSWSITDPGVIVIDHQLTSGDVLTASGEYLVPACFIEDGVSGVVHVANDSADTFVTTIPQANFEELLEPEFRDLMGL